MEILFIILKIIGILLAVLLFLCITVILVPIRYRIDVKAQDGIEGKAVIHWLFHLLDVRLYYRDRDISFKLRIFGIAIPLDRGKKERKSDKPENMSKGSDSPEPEPSGGSKPEGADSPKLEGSDSSELEKEQGKAELQKLGDKANWSGSLESEEKEKISSEKTSSEKKRRRKNKRKPGFIQKIKLSFNNFGRKIRGTADGIRRRLSDIRNGTTTVKEQIENIKSMILEETNQNAFLHALRVIRYLLRPYLPGKVTGTLNFSMGRPDQTGKALGAMGMLPFWVRSKMVVMPDFVSESFYIKAILFATGHVRFLHLLISGIRLIKDRNVRKLITNIRG